MADLRGRRTCRAEVVARLIGYALGGRAVERLTTRIGLPVSNDTLLRRVKTAAKPTTAARQAQVVNGHSKFPGCGHRKFPTPAVRVNERVIGCGNVAISRPVRDFQAAVDIVL